MSELQSILDVQMRCSRCGCIVTIAECEPDCDGDGSLGCPVPDCGGVMQEAEP
jgi:hypothetical protein